MRFWWVSGLGLCLTGCVNGSTGALANSHFGLGAVTAADIFAPLVLSGRYPDARTAALAVAPPESALDDGQGDPQVRGQVVAIGPAGDVPLADALVSTSDGRSARTAQSGRFALAGQPPSDGAYVVTHPGFVSSGAVGLQDASGLTFHLQPAATVLDRGPSTEAPFKVAGKVVGPDGSPLAGITVRLSDAAGAFSAPVVTGPDGSYTLLVYAPAREVKAGTLLAVGTARDPWVGLMANIGVDASHGEIATPLTVTRADHPFKVSFSGPPATRVSLRLTAPDGATLALPGAAGSFAIGAMPNGRYSLEAEWLDAEAGTLRRVYKDAVAVGSGTAESGITLEPLSAPAVTAPTLALNGQLTWEPVAGATAYHARVVAPDGPGVLWEAITGQAGMPLSYQGSLDASRYQFEVTAWETRGGLPRELAALGPRPLKLLPGDSAAAAGHDYRSSARVVAARANSR